MSILINKDNNYIEELRTLNENCSTNIKEWISKSQGVYKLSVGYYFTQIERCIYDLNTRIDTDIFSTIEELIDDTDTTFKNYANADGDVNGI